MGREKDASEMLPSELAVWMDAKAAEEAAAMQKGQERKSRAGQEKGKGPRIR